jgi:NADH-ubiquinone oxidoreductase chain 5
LPFIFTILFSIIALILAEFLPGWIISFKLSRLGYNTFGFFNQRFLIELFYNKYITSLVLNLGGQLTKFLDKGSIELLGPYGLENWFIKLSKRITALNTSIVTDYALYILVGIIVYIFIFSFILFDNINISLILLIILASFGLIGEESK